MIDIFLFNTQFLWLNLKKKGSHNEITIIFYLTNNNIFSSHCFMKNKINKLEIKTKNLTIGHALTIARFEIANRRTKFMVF